MRAVHSVPLRFLLGPTASGKTSLALDVAARADAEILSMDSMLVYRGMDIGTAKPTPAERTRVPHHLIDVTGPAERYDLQRYLADFEGALTRILARRKRALVVGGTGLYLQALAHGLFDGPAVDLDLRERLHARAAVDGPSALHSELSAIDPVCAERIHPNDGKRVIRALEVWEQTGRRMSEWQTQWNEARDAGSGRPRILVGLRRTAAETAVRIATRTRAMLDAGWAEEARVIRDGAGFGRTAIQALGYREVLEWIDGARDRSKTEDLIALRTRQFARRQRTWLRRFPEIRWTTVDRGGDSGDSGVTVDQLLRDLEWS